MLLAPFTISLRHQGTSSGFPAWREGLSPYPHRALPILVKAFIAHPITIGAAYEKIAFVAALRVAGAILPFVAGNQNRVHFTIVSLLFAKLFGSIIARFQGNFNNIPIIF